MRKGQDTGDEELIEQDYLMRRLLALFAAIRRSWEKELKHEDPLDSAEQLELALGSAVDFESGLLLSLAPESFSTMVQVSGTDRRLVEFMLRSLAMASQLRAKGSDEAGAALRMAQAQALAQAYGFSDEEWAMDPSSMKGLFDEMDKLEDGLDRKSPKPFDAPNV